MLLYLLSWAGFVFIAGFTTLCLAAGLFYLAELVEEYTVMTKKLLHKAILATIGLHVVLGLFTSISFTMTIAGVLVHAAYLSLMPKFPFFDFMSPQFLASVALLLVQHVVVFNHFAEIWYPFDEVISYFTLGVWLVPFTLFISLSANDNTLPTSGSSGASAATSASAAPGGAPHANRRPGTLLSALNFLRSKTDNLLPERAKPL